MLDWLGYAISLKERFGLRKFRYPMSKLVTLKQQGSVEHFHDLFVSLLNQIDLLEPYTLSVFISNLKHEVRQYLQLFKPHNLVDTFHLASQVEDILNISPKKGFLTSSSCWNIFKYL